MTLAGTFGYELDVTKISEEDRSRIPHQIEIYHKYNGLVRECSYEVGEEERTYIGEELMYAGLRIKMKWACGDFKGKLICLRTL